MSKKCPGTDRALSAAEPNWFEQADKQMSELFLTLDHINDPSCEEAFDQLEGALEDARRRKMADGGQDSISGEAA